jgi:hypothetical protein
MSEVSIQPFPQAKGAPTKICAPEKNGQVRRKEEVSMSATSKPARKRKGRPATQAAFSSRENSSNGGKFRQNFMAESYECKKGCVNKFLGNKYVCFQ